MYLGSWVNERGGGGLSMVKHVWNISQMVADGLYQGILSGGVAKLRW